MTQKYGYIRVSSKDQNLWRQIDAMTAQGICEENIFTDKITGGTFVRPGYEALLKIIKKEDILFIHGIDRLGRNYDGEISVRYCITDFIIFCTIRKRKN